jgi:hypothetical protein
MPFEIDALRIGRLRDIAAAIGPLRLILLVAAIALVLVVPTPGTKAIYQGWGLARSVLLPVLAPLMLMVLLLDALMARVFASDADGAARSRLRAIMWTNLTVAILLLLRWLPYYAALRV